MIVKFGGEIRDGERVTRVEPGSVVKVVTTRGEYRSRSVVLCAGAWATQLLAPLGLDLPLKVCASAE